MISPPTFPYWIVVATDENATRTIWTYKRKYKSVNAARTAAMGMCEAKRGTHAVMLKEAHAARLKTLYIYKPTR